MSTTPRLRDSGNHLLDRLPADEFGRLEPMLQRVSLAPKQVVQPFDVDVSHVHFPTTALVSLLTVMEEDDPVEATTVGRDGFIGMTAVLGVAASPYRVICQIAGDSLRLPVRPFLDALANGPTLTRLIHRYIAFSLRSLGQVIACNALHTVEERTSRWLLRTHDHVRRDEFPMTHEFLSFMLGVRRQTVTEVVGALQGAGLIDRRRGVIVIRDRARLEEAACECYAAIRRHYEHVIS